MKVGYARHRMLIGLMILFMHALEAKWRKCLLGNKCNIMGALEANEIMEYLFYFMMWWFYSHRKICVIDTRKKSRPRIKYSRSWNVPETFRSFLTICVYQGCMPARRNECSEKMKWIELKKHPWSEPHVCNGMSFRGRYVILRYQDL